METGLKRYEPLYLKHRPQALDMLVGQQAVTRTLTNGIEHNRLSHAYLFTGPRGTGKTSTARILAKSLNCESGPTASPCQKCASCLEIKEGISPAVFEIDAASNNSVDDARALIERAPLVAVGGRFKLYIIDECHMLTKEAFNALLKTIEEPPPQVVFVLATTEEHKVPPTIVSRCQRLMFRLVTQQDLEPYLKQIAGMEDIEIEDEALKIIARRSGGGLRDALGLLDQASLLSAPGKPVTVADLLGLMGALHEDVLLEMSRHVLDHDGHEVLSLLNRLLAEGREPAVIAQEIARHFLNLIKASYVMASENAETANLDGMIAGSPEYVEKLRAQAPLFDRAELSLMIEQLDRLESTCRRSTQPAMHIEMGLLALCHRQDIHLLRDLAQRLSRLESGLGTVHPGSHKPAASGSDATGRSRATPTSGPTPAVQQPVVGARHDAPVPGNESASIALSGCEPAVQQPVVGARHDAPVPGNESASIALSGCEPAVQQPVVGARHDARVPGNESASIALSGCEPAVQQPVVGARHDAPVPGNESASIAISGSDPPAQQPAADAHRDVPVPDKEPGENADEVWERLMEELERISLPAYSLVSAYGFPLAVDQQELTVGVMKDQFQKMVENKTDKIKKAAEIVTGRALHIRVKVVSQPPARQPQARTGRASQSAESAESAEEPEPAAPRTTVQAQTDSGAGRTEPNIAKAAPASGAAAARQPGPEDGESGGVKDAYKIFEGPGSRQIG